MRRRTLAAALLLAPALPAAVAAAPNPPAVRDTKPPPKVDVSDSDILGVLDAADSATIEQGTIAEMKAQADSVKALSKQLVAEHNAGKRRTEAVSREVGLTPVSSPISATLKKEAQSVALQLHKASSTEFDQIYVQSQIAAHEKLLKIIDDDLLPEADAEKVKALVSDTKQHVERHLDLARETLKAVAPK